MFPTFTRTRTLASTLVVVLVAALLLFAPAPAAQAADPVPGAPMRMEVSGENPLLLTQMNIGNDMGKTEGFAREYNDGWSMAQIWATVPDDIKNNIGFVLHQGHNEESDKNPEMSARWMEDNVREADALGIPVFILWDEGKTLISNGTRWQFLEHLYRTYDMFMGTVVSEQADTLGDLPEVLRIANLYGGFHILGSLEETNQLANRLENRSYWDSVSRYRQNFIFNPKNFHENFETVNSWTQGAWLSGVFDNWGPYFDGYPYYTCGMFGARDAYSNCGDRWSRSIAETVSSMMMLDQWQAGATVFHLENQLDIPTDGSFYSPYFYQSILPAMRHILSQGAPSRDDIIERTKVAFSEADGSISTLADSTAPGRSGNPNRTTFFSMYEQAPALTAVQKQMWFYLRSSGRYGIIPRIPKLAPPTLLTALRDNEVTILTPSTYNPTMQYGDARQAVFDEAYPAISAGDAFVQKSGNDWLVYNSNDRDNFAQDAALLLQGETFTRLEMPQITPHTWATVTEEGPSIALTLNTYRTDREADLLSVGGVRDMEFNRNFIEYAYVPNPQDAALRTTTMKFEVATQPTLTISGYDGNGYQYTEHFDPASNTYTLTVQSNGVVDIRLTTDSDTTGWKDVPAAQQVTRNGAREIVFDGTSVAWTGTAAGAASIDGVSVGDSSSGSVRVTGLSNGLHVLRIDGATGGSATYVPSVEHSATNIESNDFTYGTKAEDEDVLYGSDGWRVTPDGKLKLVGYVFPFYGDTTVYNTNVKPTNVRYEGTLTLVNGTSGSLMVRGDEKGKLGYFFRVDPLRVNDGRNGTAGYSCSLHQNSAGALNGGWAPLATCNAALTLEQNRAYDVVVEAQGTRITASIDGTQVLSFNGATARAGFTGLRSPAAQSYAGTFGQFIELDDVKITDLDTSAQYTTGFDDWDAAEGWMTETPLVFGWNEKDDPRSSFTFPWEWETDGGELDVVRNDVFTSGFVGHGRLRAGGERDAVSFGGSDAEWSADGDYDYWAWLKVTGGDSAGLAFRTEDNENGYQARVDFDAKQVSLGVVDDGVWEEIASAAIPNDVERGSWHLVKVTARGPILGVMLDGRDVLTAVDTTFSSGAAGVWAPKSATVEFDEARVVARPAQPLEQSRAAITVAADITGGRTIAGYDMVSVKTARTQQPALPSMVTARYSDGTRGEVAVTWPQLTADQVNSSTAPTATGPQSGIHLIEGTVADTALKVPATVMVMPNLTTDFALTGAYNKAAPTVPSQTPGLGTFTDGTRTWTKYLYVRWQDTPQTAPGSPTTQVIRGTIGGAPWQSITATMTVTVDRDPTDPGEEQPEPAVVPTNVARGAATTAYFTAANAGRVPAKIVDGDLGTAWYTGGSSDGSFSDGTTSSTQGSLCSWIYVDLGEDVKLSRFATQFGENLTTFGSMFNAPYVIQGLTAQQAAAHTPKERNSSVCKRLSGGNFGSDFVVAAADDIWTTLSTQTGTNTLASHDIEETSVRYVRLLTNEPLTAHRYGTAVYELQLWGLRAMSNTAPPAISGNPGLDSELTADPGAWSVADTEFRYQWMRGGEPIDGAFGATYTVTEEDLGATLTVRVRAFKEGFERGEATSAGSEQPQPVQNVALNRPVVAYGQLAAAGRAPSKMVDGDTGTAWYSGGSSDGAFSGPQGTQGSLCTWAYVDLGADYDISSGRISFMENLTTYGNMFDPPYEVQVLSAAQAAGLSAGERNGSTCTRSTGGNGHATVSASKDAWTTVAIGRGTFALSDIALTSTVTARYVRVSSDEPLTAHRYGMAVSELQLMGVPTSRAAFASTGAPRIDGDATVGSTLTALGDEWSAEPGERRYQWYRDGGRIDGAVSSTYVVATADVGKKLSVRVTGGLNGAYAHAQSADVTGQPRETIVNLTAPSIDGVAVVGEQLSAHPGDWSVEGAEFAYRWLRDGDPIVGAEGATYLLTPDDIGAAVSARVTASVDGFDSGVADSQSVEVSDVLETSVEATLSATSHTFGTSTPAIVRVTVRDERGDKPAGTVTISDGSTVLAADIPVVNGSAELTLDSAPPVGNHFIGVEFTPADTWRSGSVLSPRLLLRVTALTLPTATVKDGATYTVKKGATYDMISFKLYSPLKIDKVTLNGKVKDLTDNQWSDVNFIKPPTFGAVKGANTLVVYDVEGNTQTYTFTLN